MASSLYQIRVLCSTLTISSFPLEIEKNIQATKISRLLQLLRTWDRRNPWWLPSFSFAQISPLLWSFSHFWSSFIKKEVLNEEEYSILRILYCYSLQQHTFLAFCNDFKMHYRMFAYICLRNKILTSEANSVMNMEKSKFANFENSYKINENRYSDNFLAVVIRRKRKFIFSAKKNLGG